jgi:hypothetical protein
MDEEQRCEIIFALMKKDMKTGTESLKILHALHGSDRVLSVVL